VIENRYARAVEEGVHDERPRVRKRAFHPEGAEYRELLAPRLPGVDRKPPRGHPVERVLAQEPEVARAQERPQLVSRLVERIEDPQPGKSHRRADRRDPVHPVVEQRRGERDGIDRLAVDDVDLDRLVKVEAGMEELQLKWQAVAPPEGLLRPEPDVAELVVAQLEQRVGHRAGPGGEGLGCQHLGIVAEHLKIKYLVDRARPGAGHGDAGGKDECDA